MEENLPKDKLQNFIFKNFKTFVLLILTLALGIYLGQNYNFKADPLPQISPKKSQTIQFSSKDVPDHIDIDFSLFWKVWDKISEGYIDKAKVDPQKLYYGAIKGLVGALEDPYTSFLDPKQNQTFTSELSGTFDGVGIQIGAKDKQLVVISPIDGTPASEADVRAGDVIYKVGDKEALNLTLPEAVNLIRGEAGTEIKITFLREEETEPLEKILKRATIKVKSVVLKKEGDVAVVKLTRFGDSTNSEWSQAVDQVLQDGSKYLILDLRNNPGGRLQSSVQVVSSFVDRNKVAVLQEDARGDKQPLLTTLDGRLKNIKMVVLINKGSASASEIVAGALRDLRGTTLIGETSFGKGTVQEVEELDGGAGLHLTTKKWLTPKGTWVHDRGLVPDIEVKNDPKDTTEDLQLNKGLETVKKQ